MNDYAIAVMPHKRIRGFDGLTRPGDGGKDLYHQQVVGLREALHQRYQTDAHFQALQVHYQGKRSPGFPRVKVAAYDWIERRGMKLVMPVAVVDVDRPGHERWENVQEAQQYLEALYARHAQPGGPLRGSMGYTTSAGYRLIYLLVKPINPRLWYDFLGQPSTHPSKEAAGFLGWLEEVTDGEVVGDWKCCAGSWSYRLPLVRRQNDGEDPYDTESAVVWGALDTGDTFDPAPWLVSAKPRHSSAARWARTSGTLPAELPETDWRALELLRRDYNRLPGLATLFPDLMAGRASLGYEDLRRAAFHIARVERCTDPATLLARLAASVRANHEAATDKGPERALEHAWKHAQDAAAHVAEWVADDLDAEHRDMSDAQRGGMQRRTLARFRHQRRQPPGWASGLLASRGWWTGVEPPAGVAPVEADRYLGKGWQDRIVLAFADVRVLVGQRDSLAVQTGSHLPTDLPGWTQRLPEHARHALNTALGRSEEESGDPLQLVERARAIVAQIKDATEAEALRAIAPAREALLLAEASASSSEAQLARVRAEADVLVAEARETLAPAIPARSVATILGCSSSARRERDSKRRKAQRALDKQRPRRQSLQPVDEAPQERRLVAPCGDIWAEYTGGDGAGLDVFALADRRRQRMAERLQHRKPDGVLVQTGDLATTEDGVVRDTLDNVCLILERDPVFDSLQYNELDARPYLDGGEVGDTEVTQIRRVLERSYRIPVCKDRAWDAVCAAAEGRPFHPLRAYLERLEWDGVPRLDSFAGRHWGATDPLSNRLFVLWAIQAVRRIQRPGSDADGMLVLLGEQNTRKTRGLKRLFGDRAFSASKLKLGDKEAYATLAGKWCWCFDELADLIKQGDETIKSFLSQEWDTYRPAYRRATITVPRQVVFAGTGNPQEVLSDPTGSRRYWILQVRKPADLDAIEEERDQVWAEAWHRLLAGESWRPSPEEFKAIGERNKRYQVEDPWEPAVRRYLAEVEDRYPGVAVNVAVERVLEATGVDLAKQDPKQKARVTGILTALGYRKARRRWVKGRAATTRWQAPPTELRPLRKPGEGGFTPMS